MRVLRELPTKTVTTTTYDYQKMYDLLVKGLVLYKGSIDATTLRNGMQSWFRGRYPGTTLSGKTFQADDGTTETVLSLKRAKVKSETCLK